MNRSQPQPNSLVRILKRDYLVLSLVPFIAFFLCNFAVHLAASSFVGKLIESSMHQLETEIETHTVENGQKLILSRAREVASQIELFISAHPGITINQLKQSPVARRIAQQQVGLTGYTCLYEADTGVMLQHPNTRLIDHGMQSFAEQMPSWWEIFNPSLAGVEVSGYYDWQEEDGRITQKYMTMTPIGVPVEGRTLMVAATTYLDEFLAPVNFTRELAAHTAKSYWDYVTRQVFLRGSIVVSILVATFVVVFWMSRRAAERFALPIRQLADAAAGFGKDLAAPVEPSPMTGRPDEIGDLARAFNRMRFQIADQFKQLKIGYEKHMETQQALSESEAHYRSLFNRVPIGVYRTEPEGLVMDVNPALVEMFGYPDKESLIALPAAELYANPEDREVFKEMVYGRGNGKPCEFKMRRYDGSTIWVENQGVAVPDYEGRPLYYEGTLNDITEHKHAREALQLSEERFRTAFENASVGMCLVGLDGVFIEVNAALASMIGYTPAEMVGKPASAFTHPEDQPRRLQLVCDLASEKNLNGERECRFLHRDGSVVWTLIWSNPQRDQRGRPLHFISLVQDITERRKAEEELQLARFCIENAAVAIFRVADDARILEVNDHACHSLGYSRQELLGMTVFDIDPSFPSGTWGTHRRKLAKDRVRVIHSHHRRKDGSLFPIENTANYIEKDGKGFSYCFITDMSSRIAAERDREKLESQLRQAQKMEAIGTLAGGIAHDFNNILSVILGNANLLEISDTVPKGDLPYLQQIISASDRAKQLVRQILTFSRRNEQERMLVSLRPLVKETFDFLQSTLPASIEVRQSVPADAGAVWADPTQMQQVLINLCTNAAHAMEDQENGVLEISLQKTAISGEQARFEQDIEPGMFIELRVADTGPGIAPWVRERMFEPYFTTKGLGKGTGLGLSVVHGIVKAMGGFIEIDSRAGKGTSFHVFFPLANEGRQPVAPAAKKRPPGGSETLLVVDDEKALADMMHQMLGRLGYKVETRTSPIEAIEAFRANPDKYDAVITDMTMPQMNGISMAKKLLALREDLPILLCTGFSDQSSEERARAAGIREFVLKPLDLGDFAVTLRKILVGAGGECGKA